MGGASEAPAGTYYPGDEISLRVAFTSALKITAVEVVYAHPIRHWMAVGAMGGTSAKKFASPAQMVGSEAELEGAGPASGPNKRFVAIVSGVVEDHHLEGNYVVARVLLYTFSGRTIAYNRRGATPRGNDDILIPGRWPELSINQEYDPEVLDVSVDLEPEGE
jgi:hypothetical protein